MSAENKAVLRRFYEEFWNGGNPDTADELLHPDYVDHQPIPGATPGIEGFKELVAEWHQGFPDMSETIEDLLAEGDKVVGRFTFRGTHTGEFFGIAPTGRKAEMVGIDICRIVDGRIKEFWYSEQLLDLYRQLGVLRLGE